LKVIFIHFNNITKFIVLNAEPIEDEFSPLLEDNDLLKTGGLNIGARTGSTAPSENTNHLFFLNKFRQQL
jgi:hypothetical protein